MNDRSSFETQLVAIIPKLRGYAFNQMKNHADADDLVSTTLMRALSSWEQYTPDSNFRGWVFTIAYNESMNLFRKRARAPEGFDPDYAYENVWCTQPPQEDVVEKNELNKIMTTIPIRYRHVLLRCCVEGWSYEQAAAEIGVSVGLIKSRLWRARETIKQMMVR